MSDVLNLEPTFEPAMMLSVLTVVEAAEAVRVSKWTIYQWLKSGDIIGYKQRFGVRYKRVIPFWSLYEMQKRRGLAALAEHVSKGANV